MMVEGVATIFSRNIECR